MAKDKIAKDKATRKPAQRPRRAVTQADVVAGDAASDTTGEPVPTAAITTTRLIAPVGGARPSEATALTAQARDMLATAVSASESATPACLQVLPIRIAMSMDPRLQLAIANRRSGKAGLTLSSTDADEVAVVARVASVEDWEAIADVMPGCTLGQVPGGSWIVTARVPIDRAESVRAAPCVISLKASQPVQPNLKATIAAMQVAPAALPAGTDPKGGAGVVVGIVDFGCDVAHRNFRKADGSTRIEAIWHQAGVAMPTSPFGYGRLISATEIDAALATPDPYAMIQYPLAPDSALEKGTHGTHVMDIAAGNGLGSGQPGVAPEATIIFVEASTNDIAWRGPGAVTQSFGDSVHLLEAVRFIFDTAGDRPCVVNLSLGTNGGPHDGSSLVEQGLDALVNEKPNRAVVIAAGNSQNDGIHTSATVAGDADHDIGWQQSGAGGGEFELWYPGDRRLQVTLIAPDGTAFGPVGPDDNLPVGADSTISIFISNRLEDPNNQDNVIGIWLADKVSGGDWTIRLRSLDGETVDYHAWLERNDRAQSSFAAAVRTHTLGSISTGHATIVVGSYDAHKPTFPLSSFSSSGPTRDGRAKPEVSAPGHFVFAARSRTGTGVARKSGTSMAAPAVTGLCALIFAEAVRVGHPLPITALRARLMDDALHDPPIIAAGTSDPRYGTGRACSRSIVDRP